MRLFAFLLTINCCQIYGQSSNTFLQATAIKYFWDSSSLKAKKIGAVVNEHGSVSLLADGKLYALYDGAFLFPGKLKRNYQQKLLNEEPVVQQVRNNGKTFFLTSDKIISTDAPGLMLKHHLSQAFLMAMDKKRFVLADSKNIWTLDEGGKLIDTKQVKDDSILMIKSFPGVNGIWVVGKHSIYHLDQGKQPEMRLLFENRNAVNTCLYYSAKEKIFYTGTEEGYYVLRPKYAQKNISGVEFLNTNKKLPALHITDIVALDDNVWLGTTEGLIAINSLKKCIYYNGKRWLADNNISSVAIDSSSKKPSLLVCSASGISRLSWEAYSLQKKAAFFDKQVEERHIRFGFNASLGELQGGQLDKGVLEENDNDGLWTAMYIAGQGFRYAVTKSNDALENCRNGLLAMEKSFVLSPVEGFPARSFAPASDGLQLHDAPWKLSQKDTLWAWKSTTSSDEVIGHIFAYSVIADVVKDAGVRNLAIKLMDTLMAHIVKHDLYLIDHDGKPTLWGKWNPDYVNRFPINVGDRKLNSSNIISMLQSAYHFTGKKKYKEEIERLFQQHGYLDNLSRPMKIIGQADENADAKSKLLSDHWNHSDDEMYFLGYWGLYRYALNDTLRQRYKNVIYDHWTFLKNEQDPLWDYITYISSPARIPKNSGKAFLKEHPLDLIEWKVKNSQRKDINLLEDNFMKQESAELLSPVERPVHRHNATWFRLDENGSGNTELSAGDIWLLPYWLGRYVGSIHSDE